MKRISLIVACVITLTQLNAGQTTPVRRQDGGSSTSAVTEELVKLDHEVDDAITRGDVSELQRLLAEGMINVSPEGTISQKADFLRGVHPPKAGTKRSIIADEIQVFSYADAAIITSIKTAKLEWSSGSNSDKYRETNTYVRKDGRWQLIASQQHEPPPYSAKDVNLNLAVDEGQIGGNKKARVVLVEFADYQCDYCRRFAAETMKQIERDYIDTHRIAFVFHDLPIESSHPYAVKASVAAQCAGKQGRLWEMNHRLLADPMAIKPDDLVSNAQALKLDMSKFQRCLEDSGSEALVRQRVRDAAALGIEATPTFLVGIRKPGTGTITALRMIEGGYPYEVFKATLETLIAATRD